MNLEKFKTLFAFFGIYVIWGTTFLAISIGVKGFPPFLLSSLRFAAAGIILLVFSLMKGENSGSLFNWKKNMVIGLLVLTGGTGLLTWAEQYLSSTEACTIEASVPFLFIALDRKNWRFHFTKKMIIAGLIVGFIGVLVFLHGSLSHDNAVDYHLKIFGVLIVIISLICWVIGSLLSKKLAPSNSLGMNTAQQLLCAAIGCFLISVAKMEIKDFYPSQVSNTVWISIIYLVLFGSILAYISYQYLLSTQSHSIVSTYAYINPIVAVIAGWLIAGEKITVIQLAGLLVILAGVFLTNIGNYKFKKDPADNLQTPHWYDWYKSGSFKRKYENFN
jgi:drug/metabolite transporter (DMT)-like permease